MFITLRILVIDDKIVARWASTNVCMKSDENYDDGEELRYKDKECGIVGTIMNEKQSQKLLYTRLQ